MMPLLLAGVSKPREETESQRNHEDEPPEEIAKFEAKTGGLIAYIRTADKSMFFMGNAAATCDLFYNGHDGLIPVTAIAALLTTYLPMFLTAHVPAHRMIETWILSTATVALVGIGNHFNIMNLFGTYSDDLIDCGSSSPIYGSIWYAILFLMITSNRRLAKQNEDQPYSSNKTPEALHLILSFRAGPYVWQLRNSRVAISLVLACISTLCGDTWPLAVNTLIINRHGIVDFGKEWQVGTWAAVTAYSLPLMVWQHLERFRKSRARSTAVENSVDKAQESEPLNTSENGVSAIVSV